MNTLRNRFHPRLRRRPSSGPGSIRSNIFCFILLHFGISGLTASSAQAELWKCTPTNNAISYYTETPSFGDDVECVEVRGARFSKPGGGEVNQKSGKAKAKKNMKKKKDLGSSGSSKATKAARKTVRKSKK